MRQGFKPLADSRTNKRPPEQIIALRHKPSETGFFVIDVLGSGEMIPLMVLGKYVYVDKELFMW
jgi:hypothetical protein